MNNIIESKNNKSKHERDKEKHALKKSSELKGELSFM